jgi:hypothetical protein
LLFVQLTVNSRYCTLVLLYKIYVQLTVNSRVILFSEYQHPGFDYIEIFTPTVRMPTIRVVLAISALHDYHLHSIDISHAYLNGEMDCDIYMEQPEGFAEGNPRQTVCLLQKSIYGTKQGGNCWNKKMCAVLESLGFTQSYSDSSLYVCVKGDIRVILPVFVSATAIDQIMLELSQHFKLRDLGPTTQLLGIKIDRDRSKCSITISQHQYCLDILE